MRAEAVKLLGLLIQEKVKGQKARHKGPKRQRRKEERGKDTKAQRALNGEASVESVGFLGFAIRRLRRLTQIRGEERLNAGAVLP
jgi:hypothetical protein